METIIRNIINNFAEFKRIEQQFERHLEARENKDMRDALGVLKIRIGVVESWFSLLDGAERFVLRQALQGDKLDAPERQEAVMAFIRNVTDIEQTPWQVLEQAVKKIVAFSLSHQNTISSLFSDM